MAQPSIVKEGRKKRGLGSWEAIAAEFFFFGGMLAGLFGSVLTAGTWILGVELHPWLRVVGAALLILTIPMLIVAGYCLDWMERKLKTHSKRNSRGQ